MSCATEVDSDKGPNDDPHTENRLMFPVRTCLMSSVYVSLVKPTAYSSAISAIPLLLLAQLDVSETSDSVALASVSTDC